MQDAKSKTTINWEKFFASARGYIFQAAHCHPGDEDMPSIGSMESMYQAFKARMEAEREQD